MPRRWPETERHARPPRECRSAKKPSARADGFLLMSDGSAILVQQHALGFLRIHGPVEQLVVFEENLDERWPRGDGSLNQRFRERIFDVLLQSPAQRPRTVGAIGQRLVENPLLGFIRDRDSDRFLRQVRIKLRDHKLQNLDKVSLAQRQEQDDFIQTVEKFRVEGAFYLAFHQFLDLA